MQAFLIHAGVQALTALVVSVAASLDHATYSDLGFWAPAAQIAATMLTTTFNKFFVHPADK